MEFEWDPKKAEANVRKHQVSFAEASSIFGDPASATAHDPDHSAGEHRYITVGLSNKGRLLMVSHVDRRERVRIISARKLTPTERRTYEETQ